jgi:biopolymer transport protein ExbB/TolQ
MVEPVNYQHTLARTQMAEQVQETAKQQHIGEEQAFASELQRLEKVREKQVRQSEQDQEGVKVREEEQRKKGREEGEKKEQRPPGAAPEAPPEEITDDPDHHIDITA